MKKWPVIGICLVIISSLLLSQHIFCKNHRESLHDVQPSTRVAKDPPADTLFNIFSHRSPLLIWGRYDSFKIFQFKGNYWESILTRNNTLFLHGITTFQRGNIIYIVPTHFTLSTQPLPSPTAEKSGAQLNNK
ncbi:hypothetical protein [Thermoflavifilum thermophilum]|uniref:Uncharacterized protein n=1 Tax=Thermoflavifilum thermophilum TaxID=1393122 RepID=A0A1I7NHQ4_9BACT|nr:hypothetical protein [Thermoflavifilum thermophilum]SFV34192.1 hypothetical protein SAMN05660895_1929 [Thermoflavifilum thermophilum]